MDTKSRLKPVDAQVIKPDWHMAFMGSWDTLCFNGSKDEFSLDNNLLISHLGSFLDAQLHWESVSV